MNTTTYCDACGAETNIRYRVAGYTFCRGCSSGTCRTEAIELAKLKHQQKLQEELVKMKTKLQEK